MVVTVPEVAKLTDLINKEVLVAAGGVGSGALVGEYLGELTKTTVAQTGWMGVGVKALVKMGTSLLTGILSLKSTGLVKIFTALASVGSMGSILVDVFKQVYPGGAEAGGQISGLMLRELAFGAEALGAGVGVPTGVGAGIPTPATTPSVQDYAGNSVGVGYETAGITKAIPGGAEIITNHAGVVDYAGI